MVANITTGRNIYGALAYNQQKVDKGQASILSTSQIREPEDGHYDVMQAAEELLAWMPSYVRTEKPVVHISLNPDPKDQLDDDRLAEIAHEYMEGMGWANNLISSTNIRISNGHIFIS